MKKSPPDIPAPDRPNRADLSQLLALLRPSFSRYRWRLIAGFSALLAVDFLQLIIPRILKSGVDGLAKATASQSDLLALAGLIILIAIIVAGLRFVWRYLIIGFSRLLEMAIRNRIFTHILKMDALFFARHTPGDLMAHSSNDLSAVQMACGMGLVAAIDALVMSIATIGFMLHIHVQLTLLALLPMPFLAYFTRILAGRLHHRFNTVQEQFSLMTEFSRSTIVSVRLIKAYTMEKFQTGEFDKLGRKYVKNNLGVAYIQGLINPIATLAGNLGMLMILLVGGRLVILGTLTMGDFVAFVSYLSMLIWPMMAIGWVANLVQRGLTSLNRIHHLLTQQSTLPDIADTGEQPLLQPSFNLRAVCFSYSPARQPALRTVDLELGPGIHGITGRTGSGKSSLCRILARLYPVPDGQLFFGGRDVNTLPLAYIRSHIAYVGQEPILFSDTIAANIALGRPEASEEEIREAARSAAVHDDITNLPDGYATLIGERGVKLSGGQRQRLALARALICDRPVLIIDDGLSAVDVATEHEVFAGLRRQFVGKTVIIVSNRIKMLSLTDRIVIFEEGRIVSQGGHDELLAANSLYRSMFAKQMQVPAGDGVEP
ncbi:MAG: ABC transporter transmembrane domain-containing protein [Desulfoprunum sp.]|nr:ABC transporter transmembrane domain-containing protein [Desulfoprunum sp.]